MTSNSMLKMKYLAKSVLSSRSGLSIRNGAIEQPTTVVAQADTSQDGLVSSEIRDWRRHFSDQLGGRGLEIGPLHRPMVKHARMQVEYVDRCTVAELREHYPELSSLDLVEPDILGDAETLEGVASDSYDFLISAHVIEHMKNPLGAIKAWCRVLKPGGMLYLVVPDKRVTFDKKRVRSTLSHIVNDFLSPSSERDFEHYLDYAIHVHDQDSLEAIKEAQRLIATDYSIHFHVFLPGDVTRLLTWFSQNVQPLTILEGPVMAAGSDEFHFLLKRT